MTRAISGGPRLLTGLGLLVALLCTGHAARAATTTLPLDDGTTLTVLAPDLPASADSRACVFFVRPTLLIQPVVGECADAVLAAVLAYPEPWYVHASDPRGAANAHLALLMRWTPEGVTWQGGSRAEIEASWSRLPGPPADSEASAAELWPEGAGYRLVSWAEVKLKTMTKPVFPKEYRDLPAEVRCVMRLYVDERGQVVHVSPRSCPDGFREAATSALLKWRFYPVRVDGAPVPVAADFRVTFVNL